MKDKIIGSSRSIIAELGLNKWTVESVAARTGCAKGLVPYHFGTKQALLDETAMEIIKERSRGRLESVAGRQGAVALDSLWDFLRDEVRGGGFAAWLAFLADPGFRQRGSHGDATGPQLLSQLAQSFELPIENLPEAEALMALLDGIQLRLLQGDAESAVRNAYDRLWLGLLSG